MTLDIDSAITRQQKHVRDLESRINAADCVANPGRLIDIRQKQSSTGKKRPRKKKINSAARAERHSLAIYNGQVAVGFVEQRGDAFTAKAANGKKIGTFGSLKLAADAISATAEAA